MSEEQTEKKGVLPRKRPKKGSRPSQPPPGKRRPEPQAPPETEDASPADMGLGTIVVRNEFYRDGYRTMLRLALVEGLVILGLIGAMFFVIKTHQPENRYFATTEDGRLIPMIALIEPNLSTPALMSWVAQAATEVLTFNVSDYRRRLQESSRNFTHHGWDSFTYALERLRMIEMVAANQQIVTAVPRGAPVIQSEGLVMGRYQWTIQVPMTITYRSGSHVLSDKLMVTLVIVRVPRLESPSGVGIEQWLATPG